MNLLDSLLDAIVRLDGDALVMHVGEKPYVVTTSEATNQFRGPLAWGQVELSTRVLTTDAVTGMLGQILPLEQRSALDEYGATDYDVTAANHADERFTIVAARGGDDIWVEMRRHPTVVAPVMAAPAPGQAVAATAPEPIAEREVELSEIPEEAIEASPALPEPEPVLSLVAEEPAPEVVFESAPAEDAPADMDAAADIELPLIEVSMEGGEYAALDGGLPGISIADLEPMDDVAESADFDPLPDLDGGIELDLEQELDSQPFSLDSDVEAGLLAATQEWGDDVMTEGELGELLRATATAVITGETLGNAPGPETPDVSSAARFEPLPPSGPGLASHEPLVAEPTPPAATRVAQQAPPQLVRPAETLAANETVSIEARAAGRSEDNRVSRETRELPALVEYQIERDRAAAVAAAPPADIPQFARMPQEGAETQRALVNGKSDRIPSTEGVWPVSEALTREHFHVSPHDATTASAPAAITIVAPADLPGTTDDARDEGDAAPARPAAVVLPLTRQTKGEGSGEGRATAATNLQRLLRLAANRGAATVYVVANSAPLVRVDGEFSTLEGEPALSAAVVERLLGEVSPAGRGPSAPPSAEWLIDVPEIGRVRCLAFRDHRGPGIIFRMVPPRAIAADQLGLSAEVQALCSEADGLVLVTGGRDSGRSTLLTSFVDLINRTRSDHIITVESQIDFVHESKRSFISQREVRGEEAMAGTVRSACREEPDVLIIEDIRSHEVAALALEAAEAGRLVFASLPAVSTSSAIERLIELFPADRRETAQGSLAGSLRGVVSQVLLRKLRGGRVAAREVLLNTPAVAGLIMEGKMFQLPAVIENGRRSGMMSFADSLAALVREGVVHPSHAYRRAPSRDQLLATLHREGIDSSIAERLG